MLLYFLYFHLDSVLIPEFTQLNNLIKGKYSVLLFYKEGRGHSDTVSEML